MVKKYLLFLFIFFPLSFFQSCSYYSIHNQLDYTMPYLRWSLNHLTLIQFDFDALYFNKNENGRVDIYLQVGMDRLNFPKIDNKYIAGYSYWITIIDERSDSIIVEKEFDKKIIKNDWKEEYKAGFDFNINSFNLQPGDYIVGVKVGDINSSNINFKIKKIKVKESRHTSFSLSDILLLKKVEEIRNEKQISPLISTNIPYLNQDSIFSFIEVYQNSTSQKVKIHYSIDQLRYNNDLLLETIFDRQSINSYDYPGKIARKRLLFSGDTVISQSHGVFNLILSYPLKEKQGDFRIKIKISDGTLFDSTYTDFKIHSPGFPKVVTVDEKIKTLHYILRPSEKKFFDTVTDYSDKRKRLQQVLDGMDPFLAEEYFRRVQYVNERFSSTVDGWKTPVGMLFLICGEPDVSDEDTWYYYGRSNNYAINIIELPQRGKYPLYPRVCYIGNIQGDFVQFWWDCIEKWRTK